MIKRISGFSTKNRARHSRKYSRDLIGDFPPCDVCDCGDCFQIEFMMPNVNPEHLYVDVRDNCIWIILRAVDASGRYDQRRFLRVIELDQVDSDSVEAEFITQTLSIRAYKVGADVPKKIHVKRISTVKSDVPATSTRN